MNVSGSIIRGVMFDIFQGPPGQDGAQGVPGDRGSPVLNIIDLHVHRFHNTHRESPNLIR